MFHDLSDELLDFMPRLAGCMLGFPGSQSSKLPAPDISTRGERCKIILDEMDAWRADRLVACGFPSPGDLCEEYAGSGLAYQGNPLAHATIAQHLAQSIVLYNTYNIVRWFVLRAFLMLLPSPSPIVGRLSAVCLDVARDIAVSVHPTVALLDEHAAPVITPWLASTFFNAAITFAIPIFRAVRPSDRVRDVAGTTDDAEDGVRGLSFIPADRLDPNEVTAAERRLSAAHSPLPTAVYNDPAIRGYATQILSILDALPRLKGTPIGEDAADKLSALVHQTGLRQSQTSMGAPHVPEAGPDEVAEWDGGLLLEELLRMDPEFWNGLQNEI